jgi:hypothetical protein
MMVVYYRGCSGGAGGGGGGGSGLNFAIVGDGKCYYHAKQSPVCLYIQMMASMRPPKS